MAFWELFFIGSLFLPSAQGFLFGLNWFFMAGETVFYGFFFRREEGFGFFLSVNKKPQKTQPWLSVNWPLIDRLDRLSSLATNMVVPIRCIHSALFFIWPNTPIWKCCSRQKRFIVPIISNLWHWDAARSYHAVLPSALHFFHVTHWALPRFLLFRWHCVCFDEIIGEVWFPILSFFHEKPQRLQGPEKKKVFVFFSFFFVSA